MNPIQAFKLWRTVNRLRGAIDEEKTMGYDIKIGASKAIRDFVLTALAVAGVAVAGYFSLPENLAAVLGFLPDTIEKALIPLLSSFFVFALNWLKERKK